jgi:hypothetical protein
VPQLPADPGELRRVEVPEVAGVVHADGVEHDEVDPPAVEGRVARALLLFVQGLAVEGVIGRHVAVAAIDREEVVVADDRTQREGGRARHRRVEGELRRRRRALEAVRVLRQTWGSERWAKSQRAPTGAAASAKSTRAAAAWN